MINSGTQPIQNLSVMIKHSDDPAERSEWSRFWIEKGLRGVEAVLGNSAGKYCVGDEVTMADCCLIPQLYNASRYEDTRTKNTKNPNNSNAMWTFTGSRSTCPSSLSSTALQRISKRCQSSRGLTFRASQTVRRNSDRSCKVRLVVKTLYFTVPF